MVIMKPVVSNDIPYGDDWLYEVKYDGFRCILHWEKDQVRLISANNKELTTNFPEIITYCLERQSLVNDLLPMKLDGELVVLNNKYQANFAWIQKRGRLKSKDSIHQAAESRPASFLAFDLLLQKDTSLLDKSYVVRKKVLQDLFTLSSMNDQVQLAVAFSDPDALWKIISDYKGEGMIAKRKTSNYYDGKKHHDWFKVKNWRTIQGFLMHINSDNGYFTVGVYDQETIKVIGKCKHGLDAETKHTLKEVFLTKGRKQGNGYTLPPAICVAIHTLDLYKEELREPEFKALLPHINPEACTIEQLNFDMAMIPSSIELTNTAKTFWPESGLTKGNLLIFMRDISSYMLPFLKDKALTIIRSPDGVEEDYFFQKHLPSYAPEFIDYIQVGEDKQIICNTLEALLWFANHGAIEYHVPFQKVNDEQYPNEIVFDLDPPGRERFDLAVQAAQIIKPLLDDLDLTSFVKTSGNKGLQIHIPISGGSITYEETALFTQAIAWTVERAYPKLFTTERLKKNRLGRLYIDYVQHGKDKTLIAPYSPRKTMDATVATPLFWDEVKRGLRPEQFTINNVVERVRSLGCPFANFFEVGRKQQLDRVLRMVRG